MKIILEGKEVDVGAPTFGNLRKIISTFNHMMKLNKESNQTFAEGDDSAIILGLIIGKTVDEVNDMKISLKEMVDAISAVPTICGLELKQAEPSGEAQVTATLMDSTQSTVT